MDPIEVEAGGERWRVHQWPSGGATLFRRRHEAMSKGGPWWESVADAESWDLLAMAIKEVGFRAVYPEAVDPLCKAIQERLGRGLEFKPRGHWTCDPGKICD